MNIGVLGTGMVGQAIGTKLVALGHDVVMGSRDARNVNAVAWANANGDRAHAATFRDAAEFGEVLFNCTAGAGTLEALAMAGTEALDSKVLIDVSNPITGGRAGPELIVANNDSLAETVQRAFPTLRVVKALNTMNCQIMVGPATVAGEHVAFMAGNDANAKEETRRIIESFGWPAHRVVDLGDLSAARGLEMYLILWIRLMGSLGTYNFNIAIERAAS